MAVVATAVADAAAASASTGTAKRMASSSIATDLVGYNFLLLLYSSTDVLLFFSTAVLLYCRPVDLSDNLFISHHYIITIQTNQTIANRFFSRRFTLLLI